jgi:hypothetical protein
MFIKRTTKRVKDKTYVNHLLVESVSTDRGPRHRVVCSLGSLAPAPREEWLSLARKIRSALSGQPELIPDPRVDAIVGSVRSRSRSGQEGGSGSDLVAVHTDRVGVEDAREAGTVHVGHQMWNRLKLDAILKEAGIQKRSRILAEAMTLNRLIMPLSEHAMPDWIRRVAMCDILGEDFDSLSHYPLYRNLDRLHARKELIERRLSEEEESLFNLDESVYLYDLTSTYFEGQCLSNPQAKRGYSRDKRPDCKQVVVGLIINRDGFPKAHEVFDGNRRDSTTVGEMLDKLELRTGKKGGSTVVVDRGMAYDANIEEIKARHHHYIVASRQGERDGHLDDFEDEKGWDEVLRQPSPRNPFQKKTRVWIKRKETDGELL